MDKITKLTELKKLLDDGLLTQEEFDKYKSELISGKTENHKDEPIINETDKSENVISAENNIEKKVNNTNSDEEKKVAREYVQELNSSQTNHSYGRYIIGILLFVGFIGITSYNFYFKEKWENEQKNTLENGNTRFTYLTQPIDELESYSVTGIKSEEELYAYLDEVATFWSHEFKKAQEFQNDNRRFEEMLKVDRCINAYPLGFQEGLIMLNDLPMELNSKAREYFQNKVIELGFNPDWNVDSNKEELGDLDDEIESFENGRSSEFDEAEYNRQQEQSEYESSQDYYNSNKESLLKTYLDQNGNSFNSVQIGNQMWMNTNLNVDKFQNGDPIPQSKTTEDWINAGKNEQPAWCYYNNDPANGKKYGKLYNQYAVNDPRGLSPKGWHIANREEWEELCKSKGGRSNVAKFLKSASGWKNNGSGNNELGFNALPAGIRGKGGLFRSMLDETFFWSANDYSHTNWIKIISYSNSGLYDFNGGWPTCGFSVRCVKD